ncbi:MAG TPA: hypothetical protein VGT41_02555 [Candidatus Babeliales bacterium]|nr:hypothetical protein [Candidatus Babeliales bacterium]
MINFKKIIASLLLVVSIMQSKAEENTSLDIPQEDTQEWQEMVTKLSPEALAFVLNFESIQTKFDAMEHEAQQRDQGKAEREAKRQEELKKIEANMYWRIKMGFALAATSVMIKAYCKLVNATNLYPAVG